MASASKPSSSASTESPVAQQATDLLWKFQLRKEHGQMKEQLSIFITETQSNYEMLRTRINAAEKKLDKLAVDEQQLGKDYERLNGELLALKETVEKIPERPVVVSGVPLAASSSGNKDKDPVAGAKENASECPMVVSGVSLAASSSRNKDENTVAGAKENASGWRRQAVRPPVGWREVQALMGIGTEASNASITSYFQSAATNTLPARRQALRSSVASQVKVAKDTPNVSSTNNIGAAAGDTLPPRRQALQASAVTTKDDAIDKDQALPSSDSIPHSTSDETDDLSAPAPRPKPAPKPRGRPAKRKQLDPEDQQVLGLPSRDRAAAKRKQADPADDSTVVPTHSRAAAKRPQASADPTGTQNIDIPRQGTSKLGDYLLMVDGLLANLTQPTSARVESEFVKGFLDGLTDGADRKALVMTLQSQGLTTVTLSKSGKRDIMVRWADLQEAITLSKLLDAPKAIEAVVAEKVEPRKKAKVAGLQLQGTRRKRRKLMSSDDEMEI